MDVYLVLLYFAILQDIFVVISSRSHEHERVQGALVLRFQKKRKKTFFFHSKTTVPLGRHHRVMNSPVSSGLGNSHDLTKTVTVGCLGFITVG